MAAGEYAAARFSVVLMRSATAGITPMSADEVADARKQTEATLRTELASPAESVHLADQYAAALRTYTDAVAAAHEAATALDGVLDQLEALAYRLAVRQIREENEK